MSDIKYETLHSIHRVWVVMRDHDSKPVSVHLDASDARVSMIYTEEETKESHHLQRAHLLIESREVTDEATRTLSALGCTGGA